MSPNLLNIVAKIQELCSPSAFSTPTDINNKALPIWNHIITRYADEIYNNTRIIDNQWSKAISLFEKACLGRRIDPYIK